MAIAAINPDAVRSYVSTRDPEYQNWLSGLSNSATVFSLRTLSAAELFSALDFSQEIVTRDGAAPAIKVDVNQRNWRLVEMSLVGWVNFTDERGNPITFEFAVEGTARPHPSKRCLEALPAWLVRELAREILRDNSVAEIEAKNCGASPEERLTSKSEATPKSASC